MTLEAKDDDKKTFSKLTLTKDGSATLETRGGENILSKLKLDKDGSAKLEGQRQQIS